MITHIVNLFRRNFLKKLIAFVAACIMWVFVMADQDPPINDSYTVPLTISNASHEFVVLYDQKELQIETRAPRSYFAKYSENAFRVYANLDGLDEGEYQITPQVVMPQGFELIEVLPSTIDIKLDPMAEKQIPIELTTRGAIAQDSAISKMKKSMEVATVVGSKSFVEKAVKVFGNVNFSGNTSSFEIQIPMRAVDDKGNVVPNVRVVPSLITVSVDIESGLRKKIVPVVPELSTANDWELTRISVEPAQIEISGAESVVNSIVTLKTEPFTVQTGQKNFKGTLKLIVPNTVTVDFDEVTVSAEVVRKPVSKEHAVN